MSKYSEKERAKAPERDCYNDDSFYGKFRRDERAFALSDWKNNFYQPILQEVLDYFEYNKIFWWSGKKPTGHILSSQIACLNHLFTIRKDEKAVLAVAKTICNDIVEVLPIPIDDYLSAFIAFEAVSDNDLLKEGIPTRGRNYTSIDALILAKDKSEKTILIPIEWKYTESYTNTDKSTEDGQGHEKGTQASGIIRLSRYSNLINKSTQLKQKYENYKSSTYFFEPFYQLMRQTLWAEQMIKYRKNERIKADDFVHAHIIPKENTDLLKKKYPCSKKEMEDTWRDCLTNQEKYKIISPEDLLKGIIGKVQHKDLIEYLSGRYWTK